MIADWPLSVPVGLWRVSSRIPSHETGPWSVPLTHKTRADRRSSFPVSLGMFILTFPLMRLELIDLGTHSHWSVSSHKTGVDWPWSVPSHISPWRDWSWSAFLSVLECTLSHSLSRDWSWLNLECSFSHSPSRDWSLLAFKCSCHLGVFPLTRLELIDLTCMLPWSVPLTLPLTKM